MKHKIVEGFYLFLLGSFIGYAYEMSLRMGRGTEFINKGYSYGPYLPIYGYALLIILFCNKKLITKKIKLFKVNITPILVFINVFVITTAFEFICGTLLEIVFQKRWWDYSGAFLSVNGLISLLSSILFAIWGVVNLYCIVPAFLAYLSKKKESSKNKLALILFILLVLDFIFSTIANVS